jgi:hypothetical protein
MIYHCMMRRGRCRGRIHGGRWCFAGICPAIDVPFCLRVLVCLLVFVLREAVMMLGGNLGEVLRSYLRSLLIMSHARSTGLCVHGKSLGEGRRGDGAPLGTYARYKETNLTSGAAATHVHGRE